MTALLTGRDAVDVVEPAPHGTRPAPHGTRLDRDRCTPDETQGILRRHHGSRT
ncbi:hypothetical protein G8C93_11545 [Cellulosimicrobium cellulans]|uniref:hypothetical protein n=1 Tax=Cellulosimicrobium cellulans TaxID=1710 RepID=UPI0018840735|nr:hypothetical protein [Cellulosimicrobium cellulans]MBE9926518.1 hypothetical protein [Cellulosimicrobium cellulans]